MLQRCQTVWSAVLRSGRSVLFSSKCRVRREKEMSFSDNSDVGKAVSLLREAANLLAGDRESEGNQGTASSTSSGRSSIVNETVATTAVPDSADSNQHQFHQQRVLQNFRSLFAGYRSTSPVSSYSAKRSQTNSFASVKRSRSSGYYRVRETWTHDFLCLADKDQQAAPTKSDKLSLLAAGLGRKKLSFGNKDNALVFKGKMEDSFPKLKNGGGFELLRSGARPRELLVIKPPSPGYTVPFLRDEAGLGQSLIYVRPIQQNLDMSEPVNQENTSLGNNSNAVFVPCLGCGNSIPMSSLREHHFKCTKESIPLDDDTSDIQLTSTKTLATPEDEDKLCELFPSKRDCVRAALDATDGDLQRAASLLADDPDVCDDHDDINKPVFEDVSNKSASEPVNMQPLSATEALRAYRNQTVRGTQYIEFNRMQMSPLRQLMRIYKQPDIDLRKGLDVLFTGECGADMGGPSKEYFHVSLASLKRVDPVYNFQLFTGQEGHLVPVYGADVLSSGCFQMVGKLIAHSILHGGSGLVGLAPPVKEYLVTGSVEEAAKLVTPEDLPDVDLRILLEEKVIGKDDLEGLTASEKDKLEELLVRHGLTAWVPLTLLNRDTAIQDLLIAEVLSTRVLPLEALFKGMNCLGLGDMLRKNADLVTKVFPSIEDAQVDAEVMIKKIKVDDYENMDCEEKKQALHWFLHFVRESDKVEDPASKDTLVKQLLTFLTGQPTLDAVDEITVKFMEDPTKQLLQADSCFNTIYLPVVYNNYEDFKKCCTTSLFYGSVGYGRF